MVQAQHLARNGVPGATVLRKSALHIVHHGLFHRLTRGQRVRVVKEGGVPTADEPGVVIGLAPEHGAVGVLQVLSNLGVGLDAAVNGNREGRKVLLELVGQVVTQRRNLAVFFGAQTLQPGVARVDDEHPAPRFAHLADKIAHKAVTLFFVDARAVLHGDGHIHHVAHGFDAIGHQRWLVHQAGAKGAALHPVAGAAAIEVDLVVAPLHAQAGGGGQIGGLAAAELQGQRVFFGVKAQVALHVPMHQRAGGHHLGVKPGVTAQQAVKVAAMAVGPVHHRRNRQAPRGWKWSRQRACQRGFKGRHSHPPIIPGAHPRQPAACPPALRLPKPQRCGPP